MLLGVRQHCCGWAYVAPYLAENGVIYDIVLRLDCVPLRRTITVRPCPHDFQAKTLGLPASKGAALTLGVSAPCPQH